jgi:hypothetical protein
LIICFAFLIALFAWLISQGIIVFIVLLLFKTYIAPVDDPDLLAFFIRGRWLFDYL